MKHSPTPWTISSTGNGIKSGDDFIVFAAPTEEGKANLQHVIDCVNAFHGIPNPSAFMQVVRQLELHAYHVMKADRDSLSKQCHLLEDLVKELIDTGHFETHKILNGENMVEYLTRLNQIMGKVEGGGE